MSATIIILPVIRIERQPDGARQRLARAMASAAASPVQSGERPRLIAFNAAAERKRERRQSPAQLARFIRHLFEAERS